MGLCIRKIENGYLLIEEGDTLAGATAVLTMGELLCEIQDHFEPKPTIEQPTQPDTDDVEGEALTEETIAKAVKTVDPNLADLAGMYGAPNGSTSEPPYSLSSRGCTPMTDSERTD